MLQHQIIVLKIWYGKPMKMEIQDGVQMLLVLDDLLTLREKISKFLQQM